MSTVSPSDCPRLQVFESITKTFNQPLSRLFCVSYCLKDPIFFEIAEALRTFGPL